MNTEPGLEREIAAEMSAKSEIKKETEAGIKERDERSEQDESDRNC